MKRLQCEMCGSQDLLKQDGVYVCQACGTKYSVEEAKKMMVEGTVEVSGTVKVDASDELKNMRILAERAFASKEYWQASSYYSQIIEKNPYDWQAIFYKQYSLVFANVGDLSSRLQMYKKLIEVYPYTFEALHKDEKANVYNELDKLLDKIYDLSTFILEYDIFLKLANKNPAIFGK